MHQRSIWRVTLPWLLCIAQTTPQLKVFGAGSKTSAARIYSSRSLKAEMKAFLTPIIQCMCTSLPIQLILPPPIHPAQRIGICSIGSGHPLSKASLSISPNSGTPTSFVGNPNPCHLECPQTSSTHIRNTMADAASPFLSPRMRSMNCGKLSKFREKLL